MYEHQKEIWIELIQKYKETKFLWDPKHKDYANQPLRSNAYEKLFELYKKIDIKGTVSQMKRRIVNFRTSYIKEMKKKQKLMENGKDYTPTLWYYEHFKFLTEERTPIIKNHVLGKDGYKFNRSNNKIYLEKESPATKSLKRKRPNLNSTKSSLQHKTDKSMELEDKTSESSDEEDKTEALTQRAAPTKQLYNLIQRQTKLIDNINRILTKKEENWEVIGKSIGVQLYNLEEKQRVIAHKLISDVIFNAGLKRLTAESFLDLGSYGQDTPESNSYSIKEQIEYLDPESPEYLENE